MTPAIDRAYAIADTFRARGVPVVMGGIHVSMNADGGAGPLRRGGHRRGGRPLAAAPVGFPARRHAALLPPRGVPVPVEPGRPELVALRREADTCRFIAWRPVGGVPHGCDFCSVTNYFGGCYRTRPPAEVEDEIRGLRPFEGRFILKNVVFFVDDNIAGKRPHARELLARMVPYRLKWLGQASTTIARDDELLALCRQSGCMGLLIGFETLSRERLKAVSKGFNAPDDYLDAIRKIHDYGIGVSGAFVFGLDGDDEGVFDRTYEFVQKAKLESPYFSILTPYPGTRLYRETAGRGAHHRSRLVELQHEQRGLRAPRDDGAAALRRVLPAAEGGPHGARPSCSGSGGRRRRPTSGCP